MIEEIVNLVKRANADLGSSSCRYTKPYCQWLEYELIKAEKELRIGSVSEQRELLIGLLTKLENSGGSAFWDDDKVIDFVNWYVELRKFDFKYKLENRTIIESFKNGDDASKWHCH